MHVCSHSRPLHASKSRRHPAVHCSKDPFLHPPSQLQPNILHLPTPQNHESEWSPWAHIPCKPKRGKQHSAKEPAANISQQKSGVLKAFILDGQVYQLLFSICVWFVTSYDIFSFFRMMLPGISMASYNTFVSWHELIHEISPRHPLTIKWRDVIWLEAYRCYGGNPCLWLSRQKMNLAWWRLRLLALALALPPCSPGMC